MAEDAILLTVAVLAAAGRAFFSLARSALINMRRARLIELEQKGIASARAVRQLTEHSGQLLATAEVGSLISLVFAVGAVTLGLMGRAEALARSAIGEQAWARGLAFALLMFGSALVLFVAGRLAPEALGVRYSERLALALAHPVRMAQWLLAPFVRFAVVLSNLLAIPMGGQRREGATLVTEEEIKTMVDASEEEGLIEEEEKEMILSVLDFGDTVAREVMVPRIDVVALEVDTPFEDALDVVIKAGHSRIPIYRGTIDDIVGILYAKDLLHCLRDKQTPPISELVRPAFFTPESKPLSDLLQELQKARVHIAIVVDEFGGTAGLITIEDILEEIVGEIQDEFDAEEPEFVPLPDQQGYIFDAGIHISDVNKLLHANLPEDESDTLGGFIYDQLGKVPSTGESFRWGDLHIEVLEVKDRRIVKAKVTHDQHDQTEQAQAHAKSAPKAAEPPPRSSANSNPKLIGRTARGDHSHPRLASE